MNSLHVSHNFGSDKSLLGWVAELDEDVIHKAKMLKRMQVLEEKGTEFATRPLKSLPVIGALKTMSNTCWVSSNIGCGEK